MMNNNSDWHNIAEEVAAYYDADCEESRFSPTWKQIESLNTKRYLDEIIEPGYVVLDSAAGSGEYSLHLLRRGCTVFSTDLSKKNVMNITKLFEKEGYDPNTVSTANACKLTDYRNNMFDAVLCMGPLYHLHKNSWKDCISEALRVLRIDGTATFAYMPRVFTSIELLVNRRYRVEAEELDFFAENGFLREGASGFYGCSYFSTPNEVEGELRQYNCEILDHISVDLDVAHRFHEMQDFTGGEIRAIANYIYRYRNDQNLLFSSKHNLITIRKRKS